MATTLLGRTINCVPFGGEMNTRDIDGDGVFDPNDPGEIFVVFATMQVDEDVGNANIPIERTGGTGSASVEVNTSDGTAASGTDYTAVVAETVSWADGVSGVKNVQVPITDQTGTPQGDLDFTVVISAASGASIREDEAGSLENTTTVTIRDLDGGTAEEPTVIWNGDFETGDYSQYPAQDGTPQVNHVGNKPFQPPPELGGPDGNDGKHGTLVRADGAGVYEQGTVRRGTYAAKFRLPNQTDADTEFQSEGLSADPDTGDYVDPAGGARHRRRTELRQYNEAVDGKGIPEQGTRWISISHYIPSDWDLSSYNDWGPIVVQFKPIEDKAPIFSMLLENGSWIIRLNWSNVTAAAHADIKWQWIAEWESTTASSRTELEGDYPDPTASKAALASVNRGGWTDWIFHIRPDQRSNDTQGTFFESSGSGIFDVWKREDNGSWVKVIEARPRVLTVGGELFSRGIGTGSNDGGFYGRCGFYAHANQILNASPSRVMYVDNCRIYAGDSTFDGIVGMLT